MSAAMRLRGLARKEAKQILRDPSSLLIAFLMPFVLLIVNGYGISFDATHMKLAVVITAPEEEARGLLPPNGVKIVMVTALDGIRNVSRGYRGLCDSYLVKPVDTARLLEQIRSFGLIAA